MRRIPPRRPPRPHRGTAVVEMALVTPVLLLILLGIIEFGWLFHVQSTLTTAARVGARAGSLVGATANGVYDNVDSVMEAMGFSIDRYHYTATVVMPTAAEPYVTVTVTLPYQNVSIVGGFFSFIELERIRGVAAYRAENQ